VMYSIRYGPDHLPQENGQILGEMVWHNVTHRENAALGKHGLFSNYTEQCCLSGYSHQKRH